MRDRIVRHLEGMARQDEDDRRNEYLSRHMLTEFENVSVCIPRTRTMSGVGVIRVNSRRAAQADRMILSCFVLGLSTRKVSHAPLPVL